MNHLKNNAHHVFNSLLVQCPNSQKNITVTAAAHFKSTLGWASQRRVVFSRHFKTTTIFTYVTQSSESRTGTAHRVHIQNNITHKNTATVKLSKPYRSQSIRSTLFEHFTLLCTYFVISHILSFGNNNNNKKR